MRAIDADLLEPDADYDDGEYWAISMAQIQSAPTIAPERKRGMWISLDDFRGKYNEYGYKCSECNEQSDYEENFCPNCGADMRGGQNEAD